MLWWMGVGCKIFVAETGHLQRHVVGLDDEAGRPRPPRPVAGLPPGQRRLDLRLHVHHRRLHRLQQVVEDRRARLRAVKGG